jgi:Na+-driven multidrug efflux pump
VLFATVRANGATLAPLVILIVSLIPFRIGIALLGRPLLGADALWWAFPLSSVVSLSLAAWYFVKGNWRSQVMVVPDHGETAKESARATSEPAGRLHPSG